MKILLLAVLLGLVLSVDCRRRKPQRGGKHGLKKTKGKSIIMINLVVFLPIG